MQIASVPEDRAMSNANWTGSLIIAELRDWYDRFVNKQEAFGEFAQMVDALMAETRLTDTRESRWWREAYEQIAIADEGYKDAVFYEQTRRD